MELAHFNMSSHTEISRRETRLSSHLEQIRAEPPPISEPIPVVKEELLTDAKNEAFNPADFQPAADYQANTPKSSLQNHVRIISIYNKISLLTPRKEIDQYIGNSLICKSP